MHIFFGASTGFPEKVLKILLSNCEKVSLIKPLKSTISKNLAQKTSTITFENTKSKIDVFVFDVSTITSEIVYQIASAMEKKKPVVILCNKSNKYPSVISKWQKTKSSERIFFKQYTMENIEKSVKEALKRAKKITSESIFVKLPSSIHDYLAWKQSENRVSKNTFIQKTLDDKMKKDQKYKEFLTTSG